VPELTSADYFVASGLAGMIFAPICVSLDSNAHEITFANCTILALGLATSVLTNPIWVIKTRMLSTGSNTPGAYASFTTGVAQIYRSEGIPGFYRGLLPALFGVSHGALQFMAYEKLKAYRTRMRSASRTSGDSIGATPARLLGNFDFFLTSSLSKIFAGCVTYPYQVLRSRLQIYDAHLVYRGVRDAMAQIWAQEGFAGFYKGLGPNLLRVLPSTWVTFLVYENTKSCLV
jgi:solute carrier family 25 folate transporter 32